MCIYVCSRGWGFCLLDEPERVYPYPYPDKPPGVLYDVSHQCRLQYGSEAEYCEGIEVRGSATLLEDKNLQIYKVKCCCIKK